ncbi:hypothetical protein RZS08_42405, partial [Arthrospira platensis SPKY1]|nr:hypothetical protein [Arthrospira platensis SPKY1]
MGYRPDSAGNHAALSRRQAILLVGDSAHGDFAEPLHWLETHCDVRRAAGLAEAHGWLDRAGTPRVILFVQSRPGRFSHRDVEALHQRA